MIGGGPTRLEKLKARDRRLRSRVDALQWQNLELGHVLAEARAAIAAALGKPAEGALPESFEAES